MTERMVPAEPLRRVLRVALRDAACTARYCLHSTEFMVGGTSSLVEQYAFRFGMSRRTAWRSLGRVMKQDVISLHLADRWCVILGYHLYNVYPELEAA